MIATLHGFGALSEALRIGHQRASIARQQRVYRSHLRGEFDATAGC